MDTVVYPQDGVREIAKSFVCIRVEHDRSPELVKRFGVGPLSDVRLLDPEGRELTKLVGFTSATRLVSECRAALGRLEGKAPSATPGERTQTTATRPASPDDIATAIGRGVSFLRSKWSVGFDASAPGLGPEPLILWAWAAAGMKRDDPDLGRLRETVETAQLAGTYQAAFDALALATLDAGRFRERLERCARFLVESQLEDGTWSYSPAETGRTSASRGDHSNSAYALLGLAACRKAGIDVPANVLDKAERAWRSSQNGDGGWGYRTDRETDSYASMTESAVASLLLCNRVRSRAGASDPAVERGQAWLAAHYSISENSGSAYQQGRLLYHLFALERVGSLSLAERVAGHDWFAEGASFLVSTQRPDGSWDDGADTPVPNTALALLFLTRATKSLR